MLNLDQVREFLIKYLPKYLYTVFHKYGLRDLGKIKSSIYIDENLWKELKRQAVEAGLEIGSLLEELIKDNLMIGIEEELLGIGGDLSCAEIDFEPIKPIEGLVSTLTRELRDERENSLSRH